jgi:uncharacterized protein YneF (UPF0154 family)
MTQIGIAALSFMAGVIAGLFIATTSYVQGYLEQKAKDAWLLKQLKEKK